MVFIGHVDAGKSTLGGQILFQTVSLRLSNHIIVMVNDMQLEMLKFLGNCS